MFLADAASGFPDWAQHLPSAGLLAFAVVLAKPIEKLIIAWWNRKREPPAEVHKPVIFAQVQRDLEIVHAKIDDMAVRLKEHTASDAGESKEMLDAVNELSQQVTRIEVAVAKIEARSGPR